MYCVTVLINAKQLLLVCRCAPATNSQNRQIKSCIKRSYCSGSAVLGLGLNSSVSLYLHVIEEDAAGLGHL